MISHPNRGKPTPAANPDPGLIRDTRLAAGLTQTQAGEMVYCTCRAWQDWEAGARRMHPAVWELFQAKLLQAGKTPA